MTFYTERSDGVITVAPKNEGDQSALVVICHGLGDTSEGFADVAEVSCRAYGNTPKVHGFFKDFISHSHTSCTTIVVAFALLASRHSNAVCQIYSADCTHSTRHHEHGHGYAFMVRHYRTG